MIRITAITLAIVLGGTANAGWRSMRVDASSEAAFEQSLAVFKDKMPDARRYVLGEALKDIWVAGERTARAEQREYTAAEYYRQLDGLKYKQIVELTDATGETARARYRWASLAARSPGNRQASAASYPAPPQQLGETPARNLDGANARGRTPLTGPSCCVPP
jgi:hypothetical protein